MIKTKNLVIIALLVIVFVSLPRSIAADTINCPNRYLTLVNPVRGRQFWSDKSLTPLSEQYAALTKHNYPATWLLQYDALIDSDLIAELSTFDATQELGLFMEVTPTLAVDARVYYPLNVAWANPSAVFLSGYSRGDRIRLIDTVFARYKKIYAKYPTSIGAWWIDSYSLAYMIDKYAIKTVLVVADQKTTDSYGVWGAWWGASYYPSKFNILTPASSIVNKLDVVVIQWAQRHPTLAYGEGPKYSNFSFQANDYLSLRKNTDFFDQLADMYLDCRNKLGQITVGLETGMESAGFLEEYHRQLDRLHARDDLQARSMTDFFTDFARVYPQMQDSFTLTDGESTWEMDTFSRRNTQLNDFVHYNQEIAFSDYYVADTKPFLNRNLTTIVNNKQPNDKPLYLYFLIIGTFVCYKIRKLRLWLLANIFTYAAFYAVVRSFAANGWYVYYGPQITHIELIKIVLTVYLFAICILYEKLLYSAYGKLSKYLIWLLPLTYGLDQLLKIGRYAVFSGRYYIGFAVDTYRVIGLEIAKSISFINRDFPQYQAQSFLKINFDKFYTNWWFYVLLLPLGHAVFAYLITLFIARKRMLTVAIYVLFTLLFIWYAASIINLDPVSVKPYF